MSEKIKELPAGRDRYILTLVETGVNRDVACTLADDVSAMSQDSLMEKIDLQNAVIKTQSLKIDAQNAAIKAQSAGTHARWGTIDAFQATLRAIGRSLDLVTSTLGEHGNAIRSLETRHAEALKASEARQTEALKSLEARQTKGIGSSGARLDQLLETQKRLYWILVGIVVLGTLGAVANWVLAAFGL